MSSTPITCYPAPLCYDFSGRIRALPTAQFTTSLGNDQNNTVCCGSGSSTSGNSIWEYHADTSLPAVETVQLTTTDPAYNPLAMLLFPTTTGEGSGTRILFDTTNAAFRAGSVSGTQWNEVNRGLNSVALGKNTTASGQDSTVSGGDTNIASGPQSCIGGGYINETSGQYTTVGGGTNNVASVFCATIGGGENNIASNSDTTIGGGLGNTASGVQSTVGGGSENIASGDQSTVLGGTGNTASGVGSMVGGASASDGGFDGCLVFSDNSGTATTAAAANRVYLGYAGGYFFYSNAARSLGVTVPADGTAWAAISDKNRKENLVELDPVAVLTQVKTLPIYQFNYKGAAPEMVYRGPMAQDWHEKFPSGKDPLMIDTLDLDGITLAAVKGLAQQYDALQQRVQVLEQQLVLRNNG